MNQFDHYVVSFIVTIVTWHLFWRRLFLNQTTPEEWERAKQQSQWIEDKFFK